MASVAYVGMEVNGKVIATSVHYDGYPEGVGFELLGRYNYGIIVRSLIGGGPYNSLIPAPDRIDDGTAHDQSIIFDDVADFYWYTCFHGPARWAYLFRHGQWFYASMNLQPTFVPLTLDVVTFGHPMEQTEVYI